MNKILLLLTLSIISRVAYSQTNNDVYFVFTSIDTIKSGFVFRSDNINLDSGLLTYKEQPKAFYFCFDNGHRVWYWHFQRIKPKIGEKEVSERDKHIIVEKPISFLDKIDYYDWDKIKVYDYIKWKQITDIYMKNGNNNLRIFMIDKQDINSGKIILYQVEDVSTVK